MEAVQYNGRLTSVLWGVSISTVGVAKYGGGLTTVQWRDSIEYSGGCSVQRRDNMIFVGG